MGLNRNPGSGPGAERVAGSAAGPGAGLGAGPAAGLGADLPEALQDLAQAAGQGLPLPRPGSGYDRLIDAINRLPRPLMAFGSQALVIYALADPAGFARRMQALDAMPEAMWWLLGAVITAYFGAREAHHLRNRPASVPQLAPPVAPQIPPQSTPALPEHEADNPALADWRQRG